MHASSCRGRGIPNVGCAVRGAIHTIIRAASQSRWWLGIQAHRCNLLAEGGGEGAEEYAAAAARHTERSEAIAAAIGPLNYKDVAKAVGVGLFGGAMIHIGYFEEL